MQIEECRTWYDPDNDGTEWEPSFHKYDKNNDNGISIKEFKVLYKRKDCARETAAEMFEDFDTNGDEIIDLDEWRAVYFRFYGDKCDYFKKMAKLIGPEYYNEDFEWYE